jgi:hypothetical protein
VREMVSHGCYSSLITSGSARLEEIDELPRRRSSTREVSGPLVRNECFGAKILSTAAWGAEAARRR